jgi:hypothetical protein
MSKLTLTVAGIAALAAAAAMAQTSNPGFFSPAPDGDVALNRTAPPQAPAPQAVAKEVERVEAERLAALRKAEEDLDRAEREAAAERERMLAATAPPAGAPVAAIVERDR